MAQLDLKNRGFYDELTDEERKKFSTFLMLRYGSSCTSGPVELQKYYVQSCNEQMNKHFFSLGRHPKLQWLMATCVSPGMGKQRHEWLAFKGKSSKDKRANLLAQLYPDAKMSDMEALSKTMSDADIKSLLVDRGWEDKKIKEALK
jgi:hypothetical protein